MLFLSITRKLLTSTYITQDTKLSLNTGGINGCMQLGVYSRIRIRKKLDIHLVFESKVGVGVEKTSNLESELGVLVEKKTSTGVGVGSQSRIKLNSDVRAWNRHRKRLNPA